MAREILHVMKISSQAIMPTRGSLLSAGLDLASAHDTVIPAHGKGLVKTDLSIAIPEGCYARVAPRSGLAYKKFIDTGAGVIDADYRGNVGVVLFNHSEDDFEVKHGDRVAQLILERIAYPDIKEVNELPSTERGTDGFGSTGTGMNNSCATKRLRSENEKKGSTSMERDTRIIAKAFSMIADANLLSPDESIQLKRRLLSSNEREYTLLYGAVQDFVDTEKIENLKEWLVAFD